MIFNFDPPETGWSPNPSAQIIPDATAPTQPNILQLRWGIGPDPNCNRALIDLALGDYQLLVMANFDGLSGDDPHVTIQYDDGAAQDFQIFKSLLLDSGGSPATGWQLASGSDIGILGTIHVTTPTATLRILGSHAPAVLGQVRIDSIAIVTPGEAIAMAGKWAAMDAVATAFRSIDGTSFHTNLYGRVYTRFQTPTEQPDIELPYGLLSQVNFPTDYEHHETVGHRTWRMQGLFFFRENAEADPLNTSAAKACANFEDDAWEAFEPDQTLGGVVTRCEIVSIDSIYGVTSDYAEVQVTLELEQWIGAGDLRPA